MVIIGLDDADYRDIWNAPEGNEYATQFRRSGEREWSFTDIALSKQTAIEWFTGSKQNPSYGVEYRVVRLSRYPPCPVNQIISYFKEG